MTPTREQLATLLEEVKRCIYHPQPAEEDNARKKLDHVIACIAALPPPADPQLAPTLPKSMADHVVGMDRDGNLLVKVSNMNAAGNTDTGIYAFSLPRPADPPALVALRKRAQELALYAFKNHGNDAFLYNALAEMGGVSADGAGWLPAAPPVTDTPQGWPDGNNPVRWKPRPDCVIGVYCQRHGFIHGQEAEELRERLEELGSKAVNRVLDEVDARDSLAYLEATNEPTPPDAAPAAPPQEDQ